jgi:predicted secreted protein
VVLTSCRSAGTDTEEDYTPRAIRVWNAAFNIFFTVELLVRFSCCNVANIQLRMHGRVLFWKSFLNWVDLLAVLPFFIEEAVGENVNGLQVVRVMRLFRVFRIFKLGKHSAGLQIIGKALQLSQRMLLQLVVFVLTVSTIFSAVIFYIEYKVQNSQFGSFDSIPRSMWWAIVTMSTLGR